MEGQPIEVKEEPLDNDYVDYDAELLLMQEQQQQEALLATAATIKVEDELIIKTEPDNERDANCYQDSKNFEMESMNVVDEQSDIITVNAIDTKSEDEKNFMLNCVPKTKPRQRKQTFYNQTCNQCQQTFNLRRSYEQHVDFGLCTILENKRRCTVCPLSFSNLELLETHIALHKMNRFFCAKRCGKYFNTYDECRMHEFRLHKLRNIMCNICNHKFFSCSALEKHMPIHSGLKRFVCSFCLDWFTCSIDLAKHWQVHDRTCGLLMGDVVLNTMKAIESTVAAFNDAKQNGAPPISAEIKASSAEEPPKKRSKTVLYKEKIIPNYVTLSDIKIKEEPLTENEMAYNLQSVRTNATSTNASSNASESQIKTEPAETEPVGTDVVIKQEPLLHDEALPEIPIMLPKLIPRPNISVLRANSTLPTRMPPLENYRLAQMPRLEKAPTPQNTNGTAMETTPSTILKPLQIQNQNIKISPFNMSGLKIYKLLPNSKLLRLPSNYSSSPTSTQTTSQSSPIVLKLKQPQALQNISENAIFSATSAPPSPPDGSPPHNDKPSQDVDFKSVAADLKKLVNTTISLTSASPSSPPYSQNNEKSLTVKLPSLDEDFNIDAEDLKKLVNQAASVKKKDLKTLACETEAATATHRKNICKTKFELEMIEKLPQKRALIDNMKQLIKKFEAPLPSLKKGLETNNEVAMQTIKTELDECYEIFNVIDGSLVKKETTLSTDGDNTDVCADNEDDNNYDENDSSNSLIIDEREDFVNNSNNSNSSFQTEHCQTQAIQATQETTAVDTVLPSFFFPITTECDPGLLEARRRYPEHRYQWVCPRCPRRYTQKHAFRGHLVSRHGFCQEEFRKLIVEVRPSVYPKSMEDLNTTANNQQALQSESETTSEPDTHSSGSLSSAAMTEKKPNTCRLTCIKCGRKCSTRTALSDHILGNCSREPQYPCQTCPKRFFSASTLNQHMSIHTGELPHKCSFCDKRFRTRGQVTVHHRTHTGERPFECQVCAQRFTHRETLISHLSRHIGMKRYKCYGCDQQFACISGLKTHREVRFSSCGKVKLNTRAIGPRVRVIKGNVVFEAQPEINPYLRTEDPDEVLSELKQNENQVLS